MKVDYPVHADLRDFFKSVNEAEYEKNDNGKEISLTGADS